MLTIVRFPLFAALTLSLAAAGAQAPASTSGPRVATANGVLAGTTLPSGVRIFKGVPFAAPPTRDLRWKPPQPVRNWDGVRSADRFAAQCMQGRIFGDMVFRNDGVSEDCLYLNVWTPSTPPREGLPVLVYFFGGGFRAGDGSEFRYDGESMARRGIIVVTTSYRLGVFGFFAHPELTRESAQHASGNYALMDQTAALRWVKANIARFGGDPRRVTIAGESAGSFAVSAQMASPLANDLFAGAIGESGSLLSARRGTPTLAESEEHGVKFGAAIGARSLAALRGLSAIELLDASARPDAVGFGPDVDGYFFPQSPGAIYAAGAQAHVPLLAGWNSEESGPRGVLQETPTPDNVARLLSTTFGAQAEQAARVYPASNAEEALQAATDLASDRFIAYSTWKWLEEHGRTSGKPVYRYLFSRPRPPVINATAGSSAPRGAVHSAEIEYAMGNLPTNKVFAWTPDDYTVSATMQGYFANFIKTGQPNGPGLPNWPIGTVGSDSRVMRMRIDVTPRAEPEPRPRYLFLDQFYSRAAQ
ncbi:MAG: carboxylesterase family protein [Gemmatimonadota bacterium]|nr:carboxylesterase family protein [Gemmatimonadota bacterium]